MRLVIFAFTSVGCIHFLLASASVKGAWYVIFLLASPGNLVAVLFRVFRSCHFSLLCPPQLGMHWYLSVQFVRFGGVFLFFGIQAGDTFDQSLLTLSPSSSSTTPPRRWRRQNIDRQKNLNCWSAPPQTINCFFRHFWECLFIHFFQKFKRVSKTSLEQFK